MPKAVATENFTTLDRIKDGSLRITFPESKYNAAHQEKARLLVGDMIRRCFTVDEYAQCDFKVYMGETISYKGNEVSQIQPQPGMHAIPFVLPAISTVAAIRCGLKPICNGAVSQDILEAFTECFESGAPRTLKVDPRPIEKPIPVVFDTDELQTFFKACNSEMEHTQEGVSCLTDAAYVRIYQSVNVNISKDDAKCFVEALIERKYLEHAGGRLREFSLGLGAEKIVNSIKSATATSESVQPASTNQTLAKAVRDRRRLKEDLAKANQRADEAESDLLSLQTRLEELEAQLKKQPNIAQLVQEGVATELKRLLEEE